MNENNLKCGKWFKDKESYSDLFTMEEANNIILKCRVKQLFIIIAVIALLLFMFFCISFKEFDSSSLIISIVVGVMGGVAFLFIAPFLPQPKQVKDYDLQCEKNSELYNKAYNIDKNGKGAMLNNINGNTTDTEIILWIENNNLCFVSNYYREDFGKYTIPFNNIVYFVRDGDFYTETTMEVKRSGRVLGGLIAGADGLILGTNNKTINTTKEIDKRQTILYLEDNGKEDVIIFDTNTYEYFMSKIPQFEYKKVVTFSNKKQEANVNSNEDNIAKLKELAKLKDDGILSESEFEKKKKDILNRI